jgi:hypothetical protein
VLSVLRECYAPIKVADPRFGDIPLLELTSTSDVLHREFQIMQRRSPAVSFG